ncbi:hypothetical protein F8388_009497, partial [Cannabis sativa]
HHSLHPPTHLTHSIFISLLGYHLPQTKRKKKKREQPEEERQRLDAGVGRNCTELLSPYFALRYSPSAPIGDEGFRLLIGRSVVQIGFIIISASLTGLQSVKIARAAVTLATGLLKKAGAEATL